MKLVRTKQKKGKATQKYFASENKWEKKIVKIE